ncbi:uncharacterized protein ATC70_000370 [Mucor velutinosus]|uniref:F-box domain-containing protein n=1 Tax=Mucor velutinosus TaxID=708070 RepID=A0AAN7I1T7_9FUNG|nr:hypothetical protein ATC70_000370 [Mucor velutinosus]
MGDAAFYNDDVFQTMTITPRAFPQMDLLDVRGNRVDVKQLATDYHLILITLKNATCPACPQLLKVLNMYGLDPDCHEFIDPFTHQEFTIDPVRKRFFRLLLKYDAYFLVLCPGTNAQVGQIQAKTPFLDYPFISTEGGAVELVRALKVHLSDAEFMPAMLRVANNLAVDSVYIGRGPGQYFHQYLLKRLIETRCKLEMSGIICLRDAHEIMNQLKRRSIKCQQGKLASNWINMKRPLTAQCLSRPPTKRSPPPLLNKSDKAIVISDLNDIPVKDITHLQDSATSRLVDDVPSEILELVLDCLADDTPSLVRASRTCRKFYVAICNVLIASIRRQMAYLEPALPHQESQVVWDEADVADESLDRWSGGYQEGFPYRELFKRVSDARNVLIRTSEWTRHWSPRSSNHSSSANSSNGTHSSSRFRARIV